MKRKLAVLLVLLLSTMFLPLSSNAADGEGWVGSGWINLPGPKPPISGATIYSETWSSTSPHLDVSNSLVRILSYFTGVEYVECSYWYAYSTPNGSENHAQGKAYYSIACNEVMLYGIPSSLTLRVGDVENIDWSYSPSSVTRPNLTWSSSDYSVVDVNSNKITAKKSGTAVVTVKSNAGPPKYINVTVEGNPMSRLALTASPSGGQVSAGTTVTLTAKADGSTVSGCDIYYTLNGSTPTKSSIKYTSAGITISSDCTLKAIAYKDGYADSDVLTAYYTVRKTATCADVSNGTDGTIYRVTGTVGTITNTAYGNWYLADDTGEIFIYGTRDQNGINGHNNSIEAWGIEEGDQITVEGPRQTYNGQVELVDVSVVNLQKAEKGTLENPFNAVAANKKAGELSVGETTSQSYFVKGIISSIRYSYSAQYGTATFYISDDGGTDNQFYVYGSYYLENKPWVDGNPQIAVGDEVIIYGKLTNYNGIQEMADKENFVYSHNGQTSLPSVAGSIENPILAIGEDFFLYVKSDATLWTWGGNWAGQLGDGTTESKKRPIKIMNDVASVAAGSYHTLILKSDGTLWTCGRNGVGQLGDGTTEDRCTLVKIMSDVVSIAAGDFSSYAVKRDGTLWTFGQNLYGQLCDGTFTHRSTPKQVMENVAYAAAGSGHVLILKRDGTLWACGRNGLGQLGDATYPHKDRTTPVQIMANVKHISAGGQTSFFIKDDGTLWGCGDQGRYGDEPVVIDGMVSCSAVSDTHYLYIKLDNTLWGYGSNLYGQLATGSTEFSIHEPLKMESNVMSVAAGHGCTLYLKNDNSLWFCGGLSNNEGTLDAVVNPIMIMNSNGIVAQESESVLTSSAGYATFYSSESAYTLPNGLSAQVVTGVSNGKLAYRTIADGSVSGVVPKGTAVMLVSDDQRSGTYTLTVSESTVPYTGTNQLRGSDEATTTTGSGRHYKLAYGPSRTGWSDVFGWYWGANDGAPFQIEGHKAWLVLPQGTRAAGFTAEGEVLGILQVKDGTLQMEDYYDLQGRRMSQPTRKGLYIRNGKKVVK